MVSKYQRYKKDELISMILRLEDDLEFYVNSKMEADILINEQLQKINELQMENEQFKKKLVKRDKGGRPGLDDEVKEKIKELKDCGYTTRQIAKELNISIGVVSKYNPYYQRRKYD